MFNLQLLNLSHQSKKVVLMAVMPAQNLDQVDKNVKGWIAARNKEQPGMFFGHSKSNSIELIDMACKWCVEQGHVEIVNPPSVNKNGVVDLDLDNVKVLKEMPTRFEG